MWVATASHTVGFGVSFCSGGLCSEAQVIEAFSFLNWLASTYQCTSSYTGANKSEPSYGLHHHPARLRYHVAHARPHQRLDFRSRRLRLECPKCQARSAQPPRRSCPGQICRRRYRSPAACRLPAATAISPTKRQHRRNRDSSIYWPDSLRWQSYRWSSSRSSSLRGSLNHSSPRGCNIVIGLVMLLYIDFLLYRPLSLQNISP